MDQRTCAPRACTHTHAQLLSTQGGESEFDQVSPALRMLSKIVGTIKGDFSDFSDVVEVLRDACFAIMYLTQGDIQGELNEK